MVGKNQPVKVTLGELEAMIRRAFGGDARIDRAVPLGGGQINDTRMITLVGGLRYIVRVAPSDVAAAAGPSWFTAHGLRREQAVVAAAADLAPFLPVTVVHDFDRTVIDRDWVIQEVMPGRPLLEIDGSIPSGARAAIWEQVGGFTRRLHAVRGDRFGPPAWGSEFDRLSELVAWDAAGLAPDAERFNLPAPMFERLATLVTRFAPAFDEITTPRLIHSDLWKQHVFVEPAADRHFRLSGVIDLEFGRFADPLSEHLLPTFDWGNVPRAMRSPFLRGYGDRDSAPRDALRTRIYLAIGLSWVATLLAYQGRSTKPLMTQLRRVLEHLERIA